jgi:hypothetical protein
MLTCRICCFVTFNIALMMLWSLISTLGIDHLTMPLHTVAHFAWCAMQSVWMPVTLLLTHYVTVAPHTQCNILVNPLIR